MGTINNREKSIHDSVFRIGIVRSVEGRVVKVLVDRNKNSSHLIYKGNLIKNVSVGSYVKILKGFLTLIGKVEGEYIEERYLEQKVVTSSEEIINRYLIVKLVGFIESRHFCRGVNELPLIDNECHLLTEEEFTLIHTFGGSSSAHITIGHVATDKLVPISLGIGKLFSSHIGIFGNTGSGKSYTLSKLYRQLFTFYSNNANFKKRSRFLFFDFNGEYSGEKAIVSGKTVYKLSTHHDNGNKIPLDEENLLDINMLSIFSNATEKTQRPFLKRSIVLYKNIRDDINRTKNTLRKQIVDIFMMSDKVKADLLIDYLEEILPKKQDKDGNEIGFRNEIVRSKYGNQPSYLTKNGGVALQEKPEEIKNLIIYKQVDSFNYTDNFIENFVTVMYVQLIYDVLGNRAMNEHIAPAINKMKQAGNDISRVFDTSKNVDDFWGDSNVVVIDLSDVNTDTKKRIPLLLTNKLYNEHKKVGESPTYLNIIIDEAHNILSYQSNRESEEWKDYRLEVFEEIIKEGRKFGVFMTIASQRPSDISSTIISQLHNYFIHRLVNEHDINQVNNTISYLDKVSVESLPILGTGICVIAGQLADMPIVVKIDPIEKEYIPRNETINIEKLWQKEE